MHVVPVKEGVRTLPHTGGRESDGAVDLARDRALVERCQAGESAAFEELYHRYHRRLFHFCLRRLHESHEAEDAVQEAFTRAWRALPNLDGDRRFYPWLTVIAANICTDVLRRRTRLTPTDEVPRPHADVESRDIDEAIMLEVDTDMVAKALQNLSDRHQRVLQLREASGWSTQRIADYEGVAVPAAETLLWRARQALKREFAALSDTGARLGIGLGAGLLALRRLVGRTATRAATRVADHFPQLQQGEWLGRPVAVAASVVLTAGVVGGAVLITVPRSSPPPAVSMPKAAPSTRGPAPSTQAGATGSGSGAGTPGAAAAEGPSTPAPANQPAPTSAVSASTGTGSALAPAPAVTLPTANLPATITNLPATITNLPATITNLPATITSLPATITTTVSSATKAATGALQPVVSAGSTLLHRILTLTGLGALGGGTTLK